MQYADFLKSKSILPPETGLKELPALNENLFDYQRDIVAWALRRGRSAVFAGTGLGKSLMELSWAQALWDAKKIKTLLFTPLAVAPQIASEGARFGIKAECVSASGQTDCPIQITNYQKLEHFDLTGYGAVVLDESSILKNESGHYRTKLISECKKIPYKLAATATPAPNDFMELGNHAEFAGIMSYTDMLSTFFVHDSANTQEWRLKGHAESEFWKWMASWSVMLRSPSDLGYDGSKHLLPQLHQIQHTVAAEYKSCIETGFLFPLEAQSMGERLKARRASIHQRVAKAAEIANGSAECWVVWCNLNEESSMLASSIDGAVEIVGSLSESRKLQILDDFAAGKIRVLISKPSLTGFGLNWQHCHNTIFVGLNDSFEQIYQAIRRFWRFGQKNEVFCHFIASEIEGKVVANIRRKEMQAEHMAGQMVKHMADLSASNIRGAARETLTYIPTQSLGVPSWL